MSKDWDHKDHWRKWGTKFLVEVTRHAVPVSDFSPHEGPNRWAVYAYIYPAHPHFAAFAANGGMTQDAATCLPLHRYPSFFRAHADQATGEITSFQVGADYHHLHDDEYTHYASRETAWSVFNDADDLFSWLERKAAAPAESAGQTEPQP